MYNWEVEYSDEEDVFRVRKLVYMNVPIYHESGELETEAEAQAIADLLNKVAGV